MIEKCPECKEKINILELQESLPESVTTMSLNLTQSATINYPGQPSYAPTWRTYKCSNPKCWVTKIKESWD